MPTSPERKDVGEWDNVTISPGERADVELIVGESFSGISITVPVHVWRAGAPGPTVFVTGAIHGDEINGTGAIRHLLLEHPFALAAGALILVPVVNIPGFERHSRYLPDRRDLNRSFPGSASGSLASRIARGIFDEIVGRADYGIDLHTAAVRRTNLPNVRANLDDPELAALARAFGTELVINGRGPKGTFRRAACDAGCPTLILEAGEVSKVEPAVVEYAVHGIRNCLVHLNMVKGEQNEPPYQTVVDVTKWVRAEAGGFLQFHVAPGDIVEAGDALATSTNLTGRENHMLLAPRHGIVMGMTTLPAVAPGDPVCHLAYARKGALKKIERLVKNLPDDSLHERVRGELSAGISVSDIEEAR